MSSEVVSLAGVRELLVTQKRAFRQSIERFITSIKEEVSLLRKEVEDLKASLNFSQKDLDDLKGKFFQAEQKVNDIDDTVTSNTNDIEQLLDDQKYLENYSRRNNVKIMGIPEKDANDGSETWEESEALAIEAIKTKLNIQDDLSIERAHRAHRAHHCSPFRHIDGAKVPSKPRPIVVRFLSWKEKERVVRAARRIKPDGLDFFEDFSKKTLERRREKIPELIRKRKEGKMYF